MGSVAVTTLLSMLVLMDIVGNSLVCAIIRNYRNMRIPINFLIFNLATADILFALFITPKLIVSLYVKHPDGPAGTVLCKLLTGGIFAWVSAVSSICTLLAIAIERYYTVIYPHGDRWKLTKRKVKIIITASWLFSLVFISPMFLGMKVTNGICVDTWTGLEWIPKVMTSAVNVVVFGPLLVMVALYSRVVHTLWFKSNDGNQISNQQKGVIRVRKRVTLMLAVVSGIFAICWGTIQVLYSLLHYTSYEISPVVVAISNTMVLFNSAVNPFVYALSSQNFREKVKGMICKTVVHPTGEGQSIDPNTTPQSVFSTINVDTVL
ncbi:pyroglutamylated RF-amide peptide receptor-like [Acropora palmata]|uniref:pyroglutamylated RF-amide peptide receptor-like n=1 Tax=Acropora palmata TaxID=6131 RepID=UPI003DA1B390